MQITIRYDPANVQALSYVLWYVSQDAVRFISLIRCEFYLSVKCIHCNPFNLQKVSKFKL